MVRRLARLIYTVGFLFGYATYAVAHLVFSVVLVPIAAVLASRRLRRWLASSMFHASIALFIKGYFRLLGAYRFREISGLDRARALKSAIYVANHRGRMDGLFVLALTRRTGVVMKASYLRHPFFATFARYLDFVSVDTASINQLSETLNHCRDLLMSGKSLLIFPEGTRSPGGRVLPFRDIAFRLSQDTNVPVVPVVVHTDIPVLGKVHARLAPERPFWVTVRFLEPTHCMANERPAEFASRVQRQMARELKGLDEGTVWERLST